MNQHHFSNFSCLQLAFKQNLINENELKNYLKKFLNGILIKGFLLKKIFFIIKFKKIVLI
jgi:hypothetical protein